jgi:hypothetical protein
MLHPPFAKSASMDRRAASSEPSGTTTSGGQLCGPAPSAAWRSTHARVTTMTRCHIPDGVRASGNRYRHAAEQAHHPRDCVRLGFTELPALGLIWQRLSSGMVGCSLTFKLSCNPSTQYAAHLVARDSNAIGAHPQSLRKASAASGACRLQRFVRTLGRDASWLRAAVLRLRAAFVLQDPQDGVDRTPTSRSDHSAK